MISQKKIHPLSILAGLLIGIFLILSTPLLGASGAIPDLLSIPPEFFWTARVWFLANIVSTFHYVGICLSLANDKTKQIRLHEYYGTVTTFILYGLALFISCLVSWWSSSILALKGILETLFLLIRVFGVGAGVGSRAGRVSDYYRHFLFYRLRNYELSIVGSAIASLGLLTYVFLYTTLPFLPFLIFSLTFFSNFVAGVSYLFGRVLDYACTAIFDSLECNFKERAIIMLIFSKSRESDNCYEGNDPNKPHLRTTLKHYATGRWEKILTILSVAMAITVCLYCFFLPVSGFALFFSNLMHPLSMLAQSTQRFCFLMVVIGAFAGLGNRLGAALDKWPKSSILKTIDFDGNKVGQSYPSIYSSVPVDTPGNPASNSHHSQEEFRFGK